jgi:hypothetical protein
MFAVMGKGRRYRLVYIEPETEPFNIKGANLSLESIAASIRANFWNTIGWLDDGRVRREKFKSLGVSIRFDLELKYGRDTIYFSEVNLKNGIVFGEAIIYPVYNNFKKGGKSNLTNAILINELHKRIMQEIDRRDGKKEFKEFGGLRMSYGSSININAGKNYEKTPNQKKKAPFRIVSFTYTLQLNRKQRIQ